jgi:hypothetical protein
MGATTAVVRELKINLDPEIKTALERVGDGCVEDLKASSPKNTGGYAEGWRWEFSGAKQITVYNGGDHATLTHLLERGHAIKRRGGAIGHAKGTPHIKPAFERTKGKFAKELETIKVSVKK